MSQPWHENPDPWKRQALLRTQEGRYAWTPYELERVSGMPVLETRRIRLEADAERHMQLEAVHPDATQIPMPNPRLDYNIGKWKYDVVYFRGASV